MVVQGIVIFRIGHEGPGVKEHGVSGFGLAEYSTGGGVTPVVAAAAAAAVAVVLSWW